MAIRLLRNRDRSPLLRFAVSQVFDREEDLQDMLASAPEEQVQRAYCSRNLNALRSAKGQAQRKFKLSADAPHEPSQFLQFVPGGPDALACPASGKYDAGTLRKEARCSVHGTLLTINRH